MNPTFSGLSRQHMGLGMVLGLLALLLGCVEENGQMAEAPDPTATEAPAPADEADKAPEAISLFGDPLVQQDFSDEQRAALEANLAAAHEQYLQNPDSVDNIIWFGRRLAYLWRYREAIEVYSAGLEKHPDEPRLYRHRGHRYITTRDFARAVADFERAAALIEGTEDEVEPDGAPNAAGIPTSTLHTNIYYHLGLAHYLQGHFEQALDAYQKCLDASKNDDMRVATLDWLYMTLRRLDRPAEADAAIASVHADMELLENFAYHRRLLMYKGEIPADSLLNVDSADDDLALTLATQGYGVGNFYLVNGEEARAHGIFRQILEGTYWPAFGYIAAEADLHRAAEAGS